MAALSLVILLILVWALLFFAYYSAFLAFIGLLVFLPFKIIKRRYLLKRVAILLIGIFLLITTINFPIGEINKRIKTLAEKTRDESSLSSFSVRDKIGIYGLNLMMGVFAYPIYPEISKETLMMIFPTPKSGIRIFHSNFAIKSQKIRGVLRDFKTDLISSQSEEELHTQKWIYWSIHDYGLGSREASYALALNPSYISLKASKVDSGWLIDISIKVKCSYPKKSYVTLLSKPELKVEKGLFWVLQQEGWLFPYTAEWKFRINSDDDRIK